MASLCRYLYICTILFVSFTFSTGKDHAMKSSSNFQTLTVDPSNRDGLTTVQAAIDSVPSNNKKWITISLKEGVYKEQVNIPRDKPFIYLKGQGIGKTSIVFNASESILLSPTFTSLADDVLVSDITFINSYNYPPEKSGNPKKQAVAVLISGDRSAFYKCSFLGFQDTLWDDRGRHYFKLCFFEGAVDFIFGAGQSIYEQCNISVNAGALGPGVSGFITAQARENQEDRNGFVFKQCSVTGTGKALLGRAWRSFSRTIFYDTFLSDVVDQIGWYAWKAAGYENQLTYAEEQCSGPGSDMSGRVKWEKKLSPEEVQSFTSVSYIDTEGWISRLPIDMIH